MLILCGFTGKSHFYGGSNIHIYIYYREKLPEKGDWTVCRFQGAW